MIYGDRGFETSPVCEFYTIQYEHLWLLSESIEIIGLIVDYKVEELTLCMPLGKLRYGLLFLWTSNYGYQMQMFWYNKLNHMFENDFILEAKNLFWLHLMPVSHLSQIRCLFLKSHIIKTIAVV